jgi:hypothetical protein
MKDFRFFDPHLSQHIKGKDSRVVSEKLKHTALEFLCPNSEFSIATLDERTTAKELQENHPDGDRMVLASGKRFVYSDANTIETVRDTLPGKINPIAYGSLLLKECSAKHEQLRVRIVSENSDPYEVELAAQTWKSFKETGDLLVDVDPTNYLTMGYESNSIPQLLLPKSAIPEWDSKVLHSVTPAELAEKLDINVRKIELAPHNFVRSMRVLVVDSKTGASSSTLNVETGKYDLGFDLIDKDLALSMTGDGHGAISNELAAAKFGSDNRTLIQMRLIAKNQDVAEASPFFDRRVGKGVVVARNLKALGVDAVFDESIHKGGDKIPPGIYNLNVWMGEIDRSKEGGKQSISSIIPLYQESLRDIIPKIEPAAANLAAIQNDLIAVAKSFRENFELRQARLKQGQLEDDEDRLIHLLPTEKYDVIKQAIVTGNTALLQSGLCTPTLIDHLRTSYLDLAMGRDEATKFNRSMIAPSKDLEDGEICIYGLPEGTKVIVGRAPVIGRNGIHELTVKHVGDFDYSDPKACPNYILINDSAMSSIAGQQSVVADMGADFDGDCVFWKQSDLVPNIAIGVRAAQAHRDMDNIKLSKTEFGEDVSIEAAALQAETAPVGVIANTLVKVHSQISAIDLVRDPDGVADDSDRAQFAQKIRDQLYNFKKWTSKAEESLLLPPDKLEDEVKDWFERLEKCTNARVTAIIDAPRFDLLSKMPESDQDRYEMAQVIKSSMYGFSKNHKDVWFSAPNPDSLAGQEKASFDNLSSRSTVISSQIGQLNKIWMDEPKGGVYDVDRATKILESYQEIQKNGTDLILQTERDLLRDMVGVVSYQNQIAVSMKKSATVAEAPLVQRLNHFLPSKTPMMKEKKNGICYTDTKLTIDGITPQETIAGRVNDYFEKSQIKVAPAVCFSTLFDKTYSPEILGRVAEQKLAFDSDWNHAVRLSAKAKSEEGCVLKIKDSLGREIEVTNLCKFTNDLAYTPEKLAGMKFKLEFNRVKTEHGIKSYLPTEHKYVLTAQTSIVAEPPGLWDGVEIVDAYDESPLRLSEVLGTVCEFSHRDYDISNEEMNVVRSFVSAELAPAQPDLSAQYFEKARDTAIKFRTTLKDEGADLSVYAAALWHESTNRKGISVDDPNYSAAQNSVSGSICYFFPDQLNSQIAEKTLNLHRISLIDGVGDLAVGESVHFKGDRTVEHGITRRSVSLSTDGGENFAPLATPWDNAIPMDMSGRSLSGKVVAAGNSQMLLQVPGIEDLIVFGAVDKNFLGDRAWLDGIANISFEPITKSEYNLHLDGRSIGKVDNDGAALLRKYDLESGRLSVTLTQKTEGKQSGVSVSIQASDVHPAVTFDLQSKGMLNLDGKGNSIDRQVEIVPKQTHSLGVFMTGADGVKSQIGEFTTHNTATPAMAARTPHATSAKSIVELVRAGYVEWEGLKNVVHNGSPLLQGTKPNRSFAPVVLRDPGEAQLLNSNQNFALELDLNILPERLPVIQREFGDNLIGRVYADIAPKLEFDPTTGVMQNAQGLSLEHSVDDRVEVNQDLSDRINQANDQWNKESEAVVVRLKPSTLDLLERMQALAAQEIEAIAQPEKLNPERLKVVISGSRSIDKLAPEAIERIDSIISLGAEILVGDAHGIDTEVQKYLKSQNYERATVHHAYENPRNNEGFPTQGGYASDSERDEAMCKIADKGLAIWDGISKGTKANIDRVDSRVVLAEPISLEVSVPGLARSTVSPVKKIDRGGK